MVDPDAVASFYGRWARLYDVIARWTPGIGAVRSRAVDGLQLDRRDRALDIGCGTGANLGYLSECVGAEGTVLGVDLTPGMLGRARRRVARSGWENVGLVRGDATALPTAGPVDGLLATFVVGMLDDPAAAVEHWCSCLAPGGRVALLDATSNPRARVLNRPFRWFVAVSAPPTAQLRYDESPAAVLGRRVEAAHEALATHTSVTQERRFGRGFLRMTVGRR